MGVDRPQWVDLAACAGLSPAMFFSSGDGTPGDGLSMGDSMAAQLVCGECPVREECLVWAMERNEKHGVWGGLTAEERAKERRRRRRRLASA